MRGMGWGPRLCGLMPILKGLGLQGRLRRKRLIFLTQFPLEQPAPRHPSRFRNQTDLFSLHLPEL